MDTQDLLVMLDYHYWARDRVLDALEPLPVELYERDLGSSFKSIRETVTHIFAAEWVWYERWQGRSPTALLPADRFPTRAALRSAWNDHERLVRAYVDQLGPDVDRALDYTLLNGQSGSSTVGQMVQHVVNHASYHRGQITTMLRQLGAAPPKSLDMIGYFRAKQPAARA
jgi:uncharacterized damage-inducible protein DinB